MEEPGRENKRPPSAVCIPRFIFCINAAHVLVGVGLEEREKETWAAASTQVLLTRGSQQMSHGMHKRKACKSRCVKQEQRLNTQPAVPAQAGAQEESVKRYYEGQTALHAQTSSIHCTPHLSRCRD